MIARPRLVGSRQIWIIDGAFDAGYVQIVHKVVSGLPFFRKDYDAEENSEYLHLKHEWKDDAMASHPLLAQLQRRIISEVEGLYGDFRPILRWAHANDVPYGDLLHPHIDITPGVTGLYFANFVWEKDWHGEALFYDGEEAVTAVAPVPGRIVIFPADIVHRAGAPSRNCPPTRLSIAFKFQTNSQPD